MLELIWVGTERIELTQVVFDRVGIDQVEIDFGWNFSEWELIRLELIGWEMSAGWN